MLASCQQINVDLPIINLHGRNLTPHTAVTKPLPSIDRQNAQRKERSNVLVRYQQMNRSNIR